MVCERLGHLGVQIDPERNRQNQKCVSGDGAACRVLVVPTNEHLMIARHTIHTLDAD